MVKIMSTYNILFAGFGGQGILFTGRLATYAGFLAGKEVTWLPSYGAESRGGTSNCAVIISDGLIGSPTVTNPDYLMAMNLPSLDKFENGVRTGGTVFIDDSLVPRGLARDDIKGVYIPVTALADQHKMPKSANVIMMGKMTRETGLFTPDHIRQAIEKCVSKAKAEFIELNMKAFDIGYHY